MFITIYSTFNNPWASTEAGQWVEKQLGSSSWDGSMSGVLLASNMILWVGIICGYTWVEFLWSISMLHHWTIAFFPILGIFKGFLDHSYISVAKRKFSKSFLMVGILPMLNKPIPSTFETYVDFFG